jgi:hypothetical protein
MKKCPVCHEQMVEHGKWFHRHVHSYQPDGVYCSELDCEDNHRRIHRKEKQAECDHVWVEN